MKKLKKVCCAFLAVTVVFSMTACNTRSSEKESESAAASSSGGTEAAALTESEFVQALESDIYADPGLTDTVYGLSEPNRVGIIREDVKELYSKKPDSEFSPDAIFTFDNSAASDVSELNRLIAAAAVKNADGPVKIRFPDRQVDLRIDESTLSDSYHAVTFTGFDGLYLEGGENTVLNFIVESSWKGAFAFYDCKNVHINDIEIDYPITPALTGTVVDRDAEARTVTVALGEEFDPTIEAFGRNATLVNSLQSFLEYDVLTGAPRDGGIIVTGSEKFVSSWAFGKDTSGKNTVTFTFSEGYAETFRDRLPVKGNKIVFAFTMYTYNGFTVRNGENFYFENVDLDVCPGMGLDITAENVYINRFNLSPTGGRLMTSTADGMHMRACTGEVKVTNCTFIGTHDDAINVKSGYYYNLSPTFNYFDQKITITRASESNAMPQPGDLLEIYRKKDFALLATVEVKSCTGSEDSYTISTVGRLPQNDYKDCIVTNVSQICSLEFCNNYIANKRNRGILVQTRNAVLTNNTFRYVGSGAFQICSTVSTYNEATIPANIVVANNKLINNAYLGSGSLSGDISAFAEAESASVALPGTVKDIKIYNNYITRAGKTGVSLRGVGGDSYIKNNLFYNVAAGTDNELLLAAVQLINSEGVRISGNYNYNTLAKEGYSGIVLGGSTVKTDVIVESDNYKMDFLSLEGEVERFSIAKISDAEVTLDGDVSEWGSFGTEIGLAGHSLATGDEIRPEAYADVFGVTLAKTAVSETGIWLAFEVRDDKIDVKTEYDFWTGDCVEVFFSDYFDMASTDMQVYRDKGNVFQVALAPGSNWTLAVGETRTNTALAEKIKSEWKYCVKLTASGYSGELFIPFSTMPGLKESLESGGEFGLSVVFADNDRKDINRTRLQVSNVPHFVENWKMRTAKMPRYILGS